MNERLAKSDAQVRIETQETFFCHLIGQQRNIFEKVADIDIQLSNILLNMRGPLPEQENEPSKPMPSDGGAVSEISMIITDIDEKISDVFGKLRELQNFI